MATTDVCFKLTVKTVTKNQPKINIYRARESVTFKRKISFRL